MNEAMHWLFTDEATAHGGLGEYEMRKKGLLPTGNFRVLMADRTYELPGNIANDCRSRLLSPRSFLLSNLFHASILCIK
jgi:hypothetical protein